MTERTWKRLCYTVIVWLLPYVLLLFWVMLGFHISDWWQWLTWVIWAVGLCLIWAPAVRELWRR